MKKIKHYALGLLSAVLVTAGLHACSNEEANNPQQKEFSTTVSAKSSDDFERGAVAVIEDGEAVPLYDETRLNITLVTEGFFAEIESIGLVYGFNPEVEEYEAFLTIVAKETVDLSLVAIEIDLIRDGGQLFIMNPEIVPHLFNKHSCIGYNCRSCAFTRRGFFRRITGCTSCQAVNEPSKPAGCNHSINGGGVSVELVKEFTKVAL